MPETSNPVGDTYAIDPTQKRIEKICEELTKILEKHGGLESNIPVDIRSPHEYWRLKDELNALRSAK